MIIPSNPEYWTSLDYIDEPYTLAAHIKKSTTKTNNKKLEYFWELNKLEINQPLNYFFAIENEILKFGQSDRDTIGRLNRYRHQHPNEYHTLVFNELYKGKKPRLYVRLAEGVSRRAVASKSIGFEKRCGDAVTSCLFEIVLN